MSKPIGISHRAAVTPFALGALFVLCWSSGFIGAKLGASDAPVPTVLMWRFLLLAVAFAPLLLRPRSRTSTPRGEFGRQLAIGALSQSGYLLTVYWAIGLGVSTGTTALIDGIQPLVAAALVGPLLGVAVTGRQWIGLLLGLAGVAIVTWADATSPATQAPPWGYAVPFLGMLSLVAATLLERRSSAATPPLRALAIHSTTSAAVFTALAVATGTAAPPASWQFWVAIGWLIVLPTFGGYGLYWYLLGRVGVTQVNALMFLVPPVTTLWGAAMFGEPLTPATLIGLALALAAVRMVTHRGTSSRSGLRRGTPASAQAPLQNPIRPRTPSMDAVP